MFRNFQISIQSQGCFMLLNTHSYENIPSVSYSGTVFYDVMFFFNMLRFAALKWRFDFEVFTRMWPDAIVVLLFLIWGEEILRKPSQVRF